MGDCHTNVEIARFPSMWIYNFLGSDCKRETNKLLISRSFLDYTGVALAGKIKQYVIKSLALCAIKGADNFSRFGSSVSFRTYSIEFKKVRH